MTMTAGRSTPTSRTRQALLRCGLVVLAVAGGCSDTAADTSGAEGSSSGGPATEATGDSTTTSTTAGSTSGTTGLTESTGPGETSTDSGTTAATGETTGTSGSTSGSDSSSSSGSDSSSGTTGAVEIDVPFTPQDPTIVSLGARVAPGWSVVTNAAQWDALTDAPLPTGVTFPEQWLLYGSQGPQPYPGHALNVTTLTSRGSTLQVAGNEISPAADCETYAFIWPADTLLSFDALDIEVRDIDDQTQSVEASCAAGASDSSACDLGSPCATGLLCAGLIRSTVLSNNPGGLCLQDSFANVFTGAAVTIPTDGATAEITLEVSGLATVDMDVTVLLQHDHPAPEELVVELRNPDGNLVTVAMNQTTEFHPGGVPIVPTGFSGDESVNGTWSLVVRDSVVNGNNGSIQSWDLEIMSRLD